MKKFLVKLFAFFILLFVLLYLLLFIMNSKILSNIPLKETFDVIENIEKEINNPPPLKNAGEYFKYSNLTVPGIFDQTNIMRQQNGNLAQLKEDPLLDLIAQKRLEDMFEKQYFEHVSPTGVSVTDVARENGYEYIVIGENIALGNFENDQALVKAWMDSPGHRANMLNSKYTNIGIAVKMGRFENKNTWMAIQVFSLPRSACPAIDPALKKSIDDNKEKISQLEDEASAVRTNIDKVIPISREEIAAYNENIKQYNKIVSQLNDVIRETKNYISTYNAQVDEFNKCVSGA